MLTVGRGSNVLVEKFCNAVSVQAYVECLVYILQCTLCLVQLNIALVSLPNWFNQSGARRSKISAA